MSSNSSGTILGRPKHTEERGLVGWLSRARMNSMLSCEAVGACGYKFTAVVGEGNPTRIDNQHPERNRTIHAPSINDAALI